MMGEILDNRVGGLGTIVSGSDGSCCPTLGQLFGWVQMLIVGSSTLFYSKQFEFEKGRGVKEAIQNP